MADAGGFLQKPGLPVVPKVAADLGDSIEHLEEDESELLAAWAEPLFYVDVEPIGQNPALEKTHRFDFKAILSSPDTPERKHESFDLAYHSPSHSFFECQGKSVLEKLIEAKIRGAQKQNSQQRAEYHEGRNFIIKKHKSRSISRGGNSVTPSGGIVDSSRLTPIGHCGL